VVGAAALRGGHVVVWVEAQALPHCVAVLTRLRLGSRSQDKLLMEGHAQWGNRWTEIAKMVVGRTDNGACALRRCSKDAARFTSGPLLHPPCLSPHPLPSTPAPAVKNRHAVLVKKLARTTPSLLPAPPHLHVLFC
jgi:hypothetical protein